MVIFVFGNAYIVALDIKLTDKLYGIADVKLIITCVDGCAFLCYDCDIVKVGIAGKSIGYVLGKNKSCTAVLNLDAVCAFGCIGGNRDTVAYSLYRTAVFNGGGCSRLYALKSLKYIVTAVFNLVYDYTVYL